MNYKRLNDIKGKYPLLWLPGDILITTGQFSGNYKKKYLQPPNRQSSFYQNSHFFCKFPHNYERVY